MPLSTQKPNTLSSGSDGEKSMSNLQRLSFRLLLALIMRHVANVAQGQVSRLSLAYQKDM